MSEPDLRAPFRKRDKRPNPEREWHFTLVFFVGIAALLFGALHVFAPREGIDVQDANNSAAAKSGAKTRAARQVVPQITSAPDLPAYVEKWEAFEPKSKEACLKDGSGTFDAEFLACRRGGDRLVREQNGERIVIQERINDYSKVTPEDAAAAEERIQRWNSLSGSPSRPSSQVQRRNSAIAVAEANCNKYRYGTVDYRQCRGRMWQWLRDRCISLRGELPFVKAELRDAHRSQTETFCDAERRYRIID